MDKKAAVFGCVLASCLGLTACGGGGGGAVRPNPPSVPPAPAPAYDPAENQLIPTGVQAAQKDGFTGKGVKVGILGYGVDPTTPPLGGRIAWFKSYLPGASQSPNDTTGHGTVVADILGGLPQGTLPRNSNETFKGGVAEAAELYVEQVCNSGNVCQWFASNFDDFVSQQVRVINLSLGEVAATGTVLKGVTGANDPYLAELQAAYQPAIDAGIVLVWSAMNAGYSQPSLEAGLPHWIPNFQPNWLAVVNVAIGGTGKPAGLYRGTDEPSNACGVAAQWCLGAPGVVFVPAPKVPATVFTGGGVGTSFAAPIVTGTVALLLQAFPWMSAANVTDTILTTATPLDDGSHKTPNATFGWGMVNAAKVVDGPAQFAFPQFGPFAANVPSGVASTFGNAIGGPGGLKLTGPGTLVLTGANTYAGGSEIAAGTLTMNGSLASAVSIDAAGTLNGTGTIGANVANAGTLQSAGSKPGQGVAITGNLTETATSTTAVRLSDPLQVNGSAAVAGTMLVLGAPSGYTVKSTERLVDARAITGTYANLAFGIGAFYTGTLAYSDTHVDVNLQQAAMATVARGLPQATAQTIASAAHIQRALDVSNGWVATGDAAGHPAWMQSATAFLSAPTTALATTSLDSLSGEIYGTTRRIETEQSGLDDRTLSNRLDDLAHGASRGVWVQGMGSSGTLRATAYSDAEYALEGEMAGLDFDTAAGAIGVALRHGWLDADLAAFGGRVLGRNGLVALYGRWNFGSAAYFSARLSRNNLAAMVRRDVLLGVSLQTVTGEHEDHVDRATFEIGDTVGAFTPYASATSVRLHQGGFTERGAGGMGLSTLGDTHDGALAELGLRWSNAWQWSGGWSVLRATVAYHRVLSGANPGFTAAFAGVPGSSFEVEGQALPENVIYGGVGLTTRLGRNGSWFVDAALERSKSSLQSRSISAGINVRF